MKTAVRYYSRSGNTKALAEAIARGAGVMSQSVDSQDAELKEPVDVLFIGGALYAYGLDKKLKSYLTGLSAALVGKAVVFSTSWISKHSIELIRKALESHGIPVENETFYVKNKPSQAQGLEAEAFAKKFL